MSPLNSLPDLRIGWQAVDPGPPPLSRLYDQPPAVVPGIDPAEQHWQWRQAVEADQQRITTAYLQSTPVWYPLPKAGHHPVLPVFGGSPATWDNLITSLVVAARHAGFDRVRVANLVQWSLFGSLEAIGRRASKFALRFDSVSAQGSTVDLFARTSAADLSALVVDVLRVDSQGYGRRDAARDKQELLQVAQLLDTDTVTLERLGQAVTAALGGGATPGSSLSADELRRLRDYGARVVKQQREVADRLSNLAADIRELLMYGHDPKLPPRRLGPSVAPGKEQVRALEVGGGATHEREIAREIIARSLARGFATSSGTRDMLIIAGADTLSTEVLDNLTASAQRLDKQLVLLFSEATEDAKRALGYAGSGIAVFLRLANRELAEAAAQFLGKQYTFVVNGISIADGQTREWSESVSTSQSQTRSRSTSSSTNSGSSGFALNFGRSFGTSVSNSLTSGTTHGATSGSGSSHVVTQSQGRVHEYVIEPEVFQSLEEFVMLVVVDRNVVLANCDYRIAREPGVSPVPYPMP